MTRNATTYFTGLAQTYASHRPSYPAEAIDFILNGLYEPIDAADIGCGTGISTRLLAARGVRVVGIDPNADMLEQARRDAADQSQHAQYRTGTSDHTGLPDASVDLVLCAQSFHWFDPPTALREFHRILRPGGRLALMWNITDPADAFTAGYRAMVARSQADAATRGLIVKPERSGDATIGGYFTNLRTHAFPYRQSHDLDGLLGRIRSASYFPREGPLRDELEQELRRLFDIHQRDGFVELVYRTEVTLADRS